jgi:hypothetical protein
VEPSRAWLAERKKICSRSHCKLIKHLVAHLVRHYSSENKRLPVQEFFFAVRASEEYQLLIPMITCQNKQRSDHRSSSTTLHRTEGVFQELMPCKRLQLGGLEERKPESMDGTPRRILHPYEHQLPADGLPVKCFESLRHRDEHPTPVLRT